MNSAQYCKAVKIKMNTWNNLQDADKRKAKGIPNCQEAREKNANFPVYAKHLSEEQTHKNLLTSVVPKGKVRKGILYCLPFGIIGKFSFSHSLFLRQGLTSQLRLAWNSRSFWVLGRQAGTTIPSLDF
jgi:hypothetical protein